MLGKFLTFGFFFKVSRTTNLLPLRLLVFLLKSLSRSGDTDPSFPDLLGGRSPDSGSYKNNTEMSSVLVAPTGSEIQRSENLNAELYRGPTPVIVYKNR